MHAPDGQDKPYRPTGRVYVRTDKQVYDATARYQPPLSLLASELRRLSSPMSRGTHRPAMGTTDCPSALARVAEARLPLRL